MGRRTGHLLELEAKLSAYFEFIESGQFLEERPSAAGRPIRIDIYMRYPMPEHLQPFVDSARRAAANLNAALEVVVV